MLGKSKFFSSKLFKVVLIVAIASLFIFFNPYQVFNPVHRIFAFVLFPFQKVSFQISSSLNGAKNFFVSVGKFKTENEELANEKQRLSARVASLLNMEQENTDLRKQLELLPKKKFKLEGAFVISRDPHGLGNWVEIDKGTNYGIKTGMPVIVYDGILIGKVGEVFGESAQIILVSNPQSLISAQDAETGAKGIVRGEYELGSILDMVLQADSLNVGDNVVTSNSSGILPEGLLIGKVGRVRLSTDGLFQQAVIELPVKFFRLQTVFVIKNS